MEDNFDYDKYYEENIEPYLKSQGFTKMWNYFLEVTQKDYFKNFIKEIRKTNNIPQKGFNGKDNQYHGNPLGHDVSKTIRKEILDKICRKYKLHYFDYEDVIEFYIYYNTLTPLNELGTCGLFRVMDVIEETEEPFSELIRKSDDMAYPIAIRISPYASQRDLIDFIKNKAVWKNEIKFLQDKYKDKSIKIGKVRTKNEQVQKRNDFIYKNRHLPRKEIMKLVTDKFGTALDYGLVGKIISLEKERRKDMNT